MISGSRSSSSRAACWSATRASSSPSVLYVKETDVKRFIVVDGAMNDLIRPVLYEAYHAIVPVMRRAGGDRSSTADVSARYARAEIFSRASATCRSPTRAICWR